MPIERDKYERGVDKTTEVVYSFLKEHSDKAYMAEEIAQSVGLDKWNTMLILLYLQNKGLVEAKFTGTRTYYIAKR